MKHAEAYDFLVSCSTCYKNTLANYNSRKPEHTFKVCDQCSKMLDYLNASPTASILIEQEKQKGGKKNV